jgi:hypothetical protein
MTYRSRLRAYPAENGYPSHDDSPSLHRFYPSCRSHRLERPPDHARRGGERRLLACSMAKKKSDAGRATAP